MKVESSPGGLEAPAAGVQSNAQVESWSATLAAIMSRYRLVVFRGALAVVVFLSTIAIVLVVFRHSLYGSSLDLTVIVVVVIAIGAIAGWARPAWGYQLLCRHASAQAVVVVVAAALVSVPLPLRSQMWLATCGLLVLLATLVSFRRTLFFCSVVLGSNLAAHAVVGDLGYVPAVTVVGLWVGFLFWPILVASVNELLACAVVDWYFAQANRSAPTPSMPPSQPEDQAELPWPISSSMPECDNLNARQKEVFAQLMTGRRSAEIAESLGLSERWISRLIGDAVKRSSAVHKYQLAALLAAEVWGRGTAVERRRFRAELR